MDSQEIARICELADAGVMLDLVRAAGPGVARTLGLGTLERGGAVAVRAASVDALLFNRIVNLGVSEPATESVLDELLESYRAAGVPMLFVQPAPIALPGELVTWLQKRGMRHYDSWARIYRGVEEPAPVETDLRVEQVGVHGADAFAAIPTGAYGFPETVAPLLARSVGLPGWYHYLAYDRDRPVAAAVLRVAGDVGWLGLAATESEHRGRGAESALIERRIRDARDLGCRLLVAETPEDTPDKPQPSFHNATRQGFKLAYLRPNWLWTAHSASRVRA